MQLCLKVSESLRLTGMAELKYSQPLLFNLTGTQDLLS
jgi:hypothetical protein